MGAGKSGATASVVQLKAAWIKMAMSRLPFVLLDAHVYMMAREVVERTNTTTLSAVSLFQGVQNRGRCHKRKRTAVPVPGRGPRPPGPAAHLRVTSVGVAAYAMPATDPQRLGRP